MRTIKFLVLIAAATVLAACSAWYSQQRSGVSSSLVDFLYPEGEIPPPVGDSIPHLQVPLRVGLAFVPGRGGEDVSEVLKTTLLDKTKTAFSSYDFVKEIVVIPDAYLRAGGGWTSLEQVARLYQADVIALVSYDQVANTAENKASLLYWTIVGAYVIEGNNKSVQTFVDTAVFDIPSRRLLFRAPGINRDESSSTLVNLEEEMRESRSKSFAVAFDDMNGNLAVEMEKFRERIKTENVARVTQRSGGGGGGAVGPESLLVLLGLALFGIRRSVR